MATAKSILKFVRVSPQKTRLVADLIRGKKVSAAEHTLRAINYKKTARIMSAGLKTAKSNAIENKKVDNAEEMLIKEIKIDGGPFHKRFMPRARGRATPIRKRTSHITIVLEGGE
ncbi:MAG: 50S ribosomal protein L22 [Nitrospinae bacterium]|nr:50S ribosomal protein L22 [Nitrospinota bacterium]